MYQINSSWMFIFVSFLLKCVSPIAHQMSTKLIISSKTMASPNFKMGVFPEPLPDPVFYNKYIPIIFQLKVPEWSLNTLKLNGSVNCSSDSGNGGTDNLLCPVVWHFDRILYRFDVSMKFSKNIYAENGWQYFGKINCEVIESHFFHLAANISDLQNYVDRVQADCPLAKLSVLIRRNSSNMTAAIHEIEYAYDEFMTSAADGKSSKEVKMAAYIGLQTAQLMTKYIETRRWQKAFQECQNGKLSIGIIKSTQLRNNLRDVKKIAETNGYNLSIPLTSLPKYYNLRITDCILGIQSTKETVLMVRVLVPVQKKGSKFRRLKLNKIPYLIEEDGAKMICEMKSFDSKNDFLEESTETMGKDKLKVEKVYSIAPDCYESDLCFVPEQTKDYIVDPCLEGLLNGTIAMIQEHCSFECYPATNEFLTLPIIQKIGTNDFSVTGGHDIFPVGIYCDGKLSKTLEPNRTNGVLQVTLPCNCEIRFRTSVYKPSSPCKEELLQVHQLFSIPDRVTPTTPTPTTPTPTTSTPTTPAPTTPTPKQATVSEAPVPVRPDPVPAYCNVPAKVVPNISCSTDWEFVAIWILTSITFVLICIVFLIFYANDQLNFKGPRNRSINPENRSSIPLKTLKEEECPPPPSIRDYNNPSPQSPGDNPNLPLPPTEDNNFENDFHLEQLVEDPVDSEPAILYL